MSYSCKEIQNLLNGYIDVELDENEAGAVEAHISSCKECAAQAEAFGQIARLLKESEIAPLPADFHEKLHQRLTLEQSVPVKKRRFSKYRAASAIAAGFLVVFVLGSQIYTQYPFGSRQEQKSITAGDMATIDGITDMSANIVQAPTPVASPSPNEFAYDKADNEKARTLQPKPAMENATADKAETDTSSAVQPSAKPEAEARNEAAASAEFGTAQISAASENAKASNPAWTQYTVKAENPDEIYRHLAEYYQFENTDSGYIIKADAEQADDIIADISNKFHAEIESKALEDGDENIIIIKK